MKKIILSLIILIALNNTAFAHLPTAPLNNNNSIFQEELEKNYKEIENFYKKYNLSIPNNFNNQNLLLEKNKFNNIHKEEINKIISNKNNLLMNFMGNDFHQMYFKSFSPFSKFNKFFLKEEENIIETAIITNYLFPTNFNFTNTIPSKKMEKLLNHYNKEHLKNNNKLENTFKKYNLEELKPNGFYSLNVKAQEQILKETSDFLLTAKIISFIYEETWKQMFQTYPYFNNKITKINAQTFTPNEKMQKPENNELRESMFFGLQIKLDEMEEHNKLIENSLPSLIIKEVEDRFINWELNEYNNLSEEDKNILKFFGGFFK